MFWKIVKVVLIRLLNKPDALRITLQQWLDALTAAAEATVTVIDDFACQVAVALLADDQLWAAFVAWYQSILNGGILVGADPAISGEVLRVDPDTIALARQIADVTGFDYQKILDLLLEVAKVLLDWWNNRKAAEA